MDGNYICNEEHRKRMEYKATVLIQSCMFHIENTVTGEKVTPQKQDIDFYKYVFNDTVTIKVKGDLFFVDDAYHTSSGQLT